MFTASGHPGFPQHGNVIRHNNFYDNNFNPFQQGSDVEPFLVDHPKVMFRMLQAQARRLRNANLWRS